MVRDSHTKKKEKQQKTQWLVPFFFLTNSAPIYKFTNYGEEK
jgi:hypothetical protein